MTTGDEEADTGVECGRELRRYARAVLDRDTGRVGSAADEVRAKIGEVALSRAAGVVAFFDAINRVADATGVELDSYVDVPPELDLSWIEQKRALAG